MNLFGLWRQNCSVCSSWSRPSALPWDSRGKYISPAPPFLTLCRAFISRGLRPYRPRRRTLSSLLVRLRRPTLHRPLRGLRQRAFAPLRSPSSHLLLAARFGCRRTVQSVHIRCAAHTALFLPGGNAVSFHIPVIMRNRGYIAAYSQKLDQGKTALFSHGASLLDLRFSDIPNSTGGTDITLRAGGGFGSIRR